MGYDYVIVGAGAAGCALAGRLSENPDVSVLVLEAGPNDDSPFIQMPVAYPQLFKSQRDWDLATDPEPGLNDRSVVLAQGKVVGGSSSINGMVYMRGGRRDYDGWAEAGATGWSYDEVLPYFKRAEDNVRGANDYHGIGGPLSVGENRSRHPLAAAFLKAAWADGIRRNEDFNGESQEGVFWHQVTQRDGQRCSAADAYLHPALSRPNIDLWHDTAATRLVFDGKRATGVEVLRCGKTERVDVDKEVIVSAGTYLSPVLLMASGIGPAEEIAALGIPVVEDLPVGRNLQDHLMMPIVYRTDQVSLLGAFTPENLERYEREGAGPLSSGAGEAGGFIHSGMSEEVDFQLSALPGLFDGMREVTEHGVTVAGWPMYPTSVGSVRLRTADALTKPRITHNYLMTEHDQKVAVGGLGRIMEITQRPEFRAVATDPFLLPASSSYDDVLAHARRVAATTYHPVGTCAIGQVVDPELRVLGVDGLRVVDASIMPTVPGGNTNAPAMMVGEKAADLIKATWG